MVSLILFTCQKGEFGHILGFNEYQKAQAFTEKLFFIAQYVWIGILPDAIVIIVVNPTRLPLQAGENKHCLF